MIKIAKVRKVLNHYLNVYCEEQGLKSMDATIVFFDKSTK